MYYIIGLSNFGKLAIALNELTVTASVEYVVIFDAGSTGTRS